MKAKTDDLMARVVKAIQPNDNAGGEWLAKPAGHGPEWMICGPVYRTRKSRMVLAMIEVDGFTAEEAEENNRAIAEFIVESVNARIRAALARAEGN